METAERSDRRWNTIALVAFAWVSAFVAWRHEPWRDELQAWMIARASSTPGALLRNLQHEGHPFLWYAVLWPFARIQRSLWMFQSLQWMIAVLTAAVVLWRAPFTRLTRVLIVFGYFSVFEYGILARSYALGALLVVLAMSFAAPRCRWFPLGITLTALTLTSAFGAIVAVAIVASMVIQHRHELRTSERGRAIGACAMVVVGCTLAYVQARPSASSGTFTRWNTSFDAHLSATAVSAIFRAVVPVPKLQHNWWNTSIADGHTGIAAAVSLVILGLGAYALRRSLGAAALWVGGSSAIVVFLYTKLGQADAARYYGHIWLILVAACWIHAATGPEPIRAQPRWTYLVMGLAIIHVVVGIGALGADVNQPFTDSAAAAEWLRSHQGSTATIISCPDFSGSAIAGYLDRKIVYPQGTREGTFIVWDQRRTRVVADPNDVFASALRSGPAPVYFVANARVPALRTALVFTRARGIVVDEHAWIYRITEQVPPVRSDLCRTP